VAGLGGHSAVVDARRDGRPDAVRGLARSYLFEDLDEADLAPLAAAARVNRLVRGEYLWRPGEPADEIVVVVEGEVKDSVVDADGN